LPVKFNLTDPVERTPKGEATSKAAHRLCLHPRPVIMHVQHGRDVMPKIFIPRAGK
jgi:hypothetical protein